MTGGFFAGAGWTGMGVTLGVGSDNSGWFFPGFQDALRSVSDVDDALSTVAHRMCTATRCAS
ncbi:hypothetical protein GCM10027445_60300 [Amycolatopsis endophytica]